MIRFLRSNSCPLVYLLSFPASIREIGGGVFALVRGTTVINPIALCLRAHCSLTWLQIFEWIFSRFVFFFCFLLEEYQHLLFSVLSLLLKGSRSCNYDTALMTVSGNIFWIITAQGREEGFFLRCFCPVVSPTAVLLRLQPDVTFVSAVAHFAAVSV